ncbi:tannase/feruloyl esterase family alpha/beta hydrolase [Undibacterium sp.]|jgi:pimeloyl-ACP methyl ester carboxylesterase|uniref:tannase/feruloyl esterase family alpha/beta hydrolase n=1 Tax=Undibacterium sp. TaxID=1914977 RepID=UPI002C2878D5|nr:tannase/feruloyl esterase family alpha/beta hydrolase [Undibacterium sp.]HTD03414.1 tannase/feruloyl esterase family alpha/beta hydrolase [Undibacterium sp.]
MKFKLPVTSARLRLVCVAGSVLVIVAGCGGGSDPATSTVAAKTSAEMCAAMQGLDVPALEIGLPTSGASIASATLIAATAKDNISGEYCKVLGKIQPVDFSAPDIRFEVDLPSVWNGKSVHFGGGGLDGTIPATTGFTSSSLTFTEVNGAKTPLARGYVTLGSDSGHQGNASEGTFLQNDEAMANYAGEHVKKTHDVAQFLAKNRYGAPFSHSYYVGGSGGGRQGLVAAQRYPADYDGVIATYPASELLGLSFQMGRVSQASLAPGGFISVAKASVLKAAVMAQCDSLDGATDGIISNPALCHFDPATIRCPGGVDSGNTCLSDAQINTVNTMATPLVTSFDFANGIRTIPAYNILSGTDFWNPYITPLGTSAQNAIVDPATAAAGQGSFFYSFPNGLVRFAIARNPAIDLMTFNFSNPGALTDRTRTVSNLMDATSTDMTAFKNRGGKLILQHGQSDQFIPAQMSIDYYNRLLASYGQGELSSFLKFYLVPGGSHGYGGQFEGAYDGLTVLDNWVTKGVTPSNLVITDMNSPTAGRTRPLCEYPQWPKYIAGDVNVASSFSCSN